MSQRRTPSDQSSVALDRLIADRGVRSVFQPLVDLGSNTVTGYEALTRVGDDAGFSDPGDLFDEALRHGRLWELELLTRRVSLESLPPWPDGALLFMNCNPEVAADPRFAQVFLDLLAETGRLEPSSVVLEITERAETQHTAGLAEQIRLLRLAGMQIAIDDLGAGVSGLQRIMELRPNWLKLDRELTAGVERDPYKQNLLDVLMRFTRVSGVRLVAEGVETFDQLDALLTLGVRHAQGYLIGRPAERLSGLAMPLSNWISARRERAERRDQRPNLAFLASVMQEAVTSPADAPISEALRSLERAPAAGGVAATRGGVFCGWAPVDRIRRIALERGIDAPLSAAATDDALTAPATTLVSEALLLLTTRRPGNLAEPILVEDGGEIVGEAPVHTLLREASRLVATQEGDYSQLSGLPGRVQCDRRLTSLIGADEDAHALFIDVRGFHGYNERFGFELGDLILRILAGVVACRTVDSVHEFAGHLGDDRFLLVTHDADPHAVAAQLIEEFESATDRFVACTEDDAGAAGLRIVLVRRPGVDCRTPTEVHDAASRQRSEGAGRAVGRSIIVDGPDPTTIGTVRLSA